MTTQTSLFDQPLKPSKPVRRTSAKALEQIEKDGLLSALRLKVYRALYEHGPLTAGEVNRVCLEEGQVTPGYHKRLSELERLGVARRVGVRFCSVSGLECEIWDVTDALPSKPKSSARRTYSVLAVGETPEGAVLQFATAVGWNLKTDPIKGGPTGRYDWTATVETTDGQSFEAAGFRVPGGYVLSVWK